jgi:periplasmic copper chaperone A
MRKPGFPALVLTLALALGACGSEAPAPPPSPQANQNPEAPAGIAVSDARVQLPIVSGRPGVAYLRVSQTGGAPRRIAAVHVTGVGRAELHETRQEAGKSSMAAVDQLPLAPGETVEFKPGGYHVMLMDLDPALKPGATTELTVTFDNGDKASTKAQVVTVGAEHAR